MNEPVAIIEINIAHYQEMLKLVLSEDQRAAIERLLVTAELDLEDAMSPDSD